MALFDAFLKLEGIDGESQDSKHKGEIDLLSWSWGMAQTGSGHGLGGSGTGKVSVHDISVTKLTDKSSCSLMAFCASGKHIPTGLITARKAGGDEPVEYLKIKLTDVLISGYQQGGSGGDVAQENVSINFAKFNVEYFQQDEKGVGKAAGQMGWDVKANVKA